MFEIHEDNEHRERKLYLAFKSKEEVEDYLFDRGYKLDTLGRYYKKIGCSIDYCIISELPVYNKGLF